MIGGKRDRGLNQDGNSLVKAEISSNDDGAWPNLLTTQPFLAGNPTMEIVAILLLTVAMVGIGWAANDRGEVRTVGSDETVRKLDA